MKSTMAFFSEGQQSTGNTFQAAAVFATATPTVTPTLEPTATPTETPVPTITPTPTNTPTPTPVGDVLPAFSVFRKTSCTAQVLNNNSQIRTDKLTAWSLTRGTWNVENVRTVNLLFGSNPFFNTDQTVSANETATFSGLSTPVILDKAAQAWCSR
jgi:hypothetical protein